MRSTRLLEILGLLDKYSIDFNELVFTSVILCAQESGEEMPQIVSDYFCCRICVKGRTGDMLEGLKKAGVIEASYEIPAKGSTLILQDIPLNKRFVQDLIRTELYLIE